MISNAYRKIMLSLGILGPLIGLSSIFISICLHPWFSLTENAISDLGALNIKYNYILNYGLVTTGVLGFIYFLGLSNYIENWIWRLGIAITLLADIFLILIGVFPEGTPPHYPVSIGFFSIFAIALFTSSTALILKKNMIGWIFFIIDVIGVILGYLSLNIFNGAAVAEFIGIVIIVSWIYMTIYLVIKSHT